MSDFVANACQKLGNNTKTRILLGGAGILVVAWAQSPAPRPQRDAVAEAQRQPPIARSTRPEQQKSAHDESGIFVDLKAPASSPVLKTQPKEGKISGFDFARDPLNSDRPDADPGRDHEEGDCEQAERNGGSTQSSWRAVTISNPSWILRRRCPAGSLS